MVAHIVDRGYRHDDNRPYRHQEQSQVEGHHEGVERGVIVEVAPRLGTKQLDGAVERRRRRHEHGEHRGIIARDIVEVDDIGILTVELAQSVGAAHEHEQGEEEQEVLVAERIDEHADGVVGGHGRQQFTLAHPSHRHLVARHLHPYAVDRVAGYRLDVGHHDMVATEERHTVDGQRILVDELGRHAAVGVVLQMERIGLHQEVEVLRVVVGGIERERVHLCLRQFQRLGGHRLAVVAGGEHQHSQEREDTTSHRHSSDSDDNQTQAETRDRRRVATRGARATDGAWRGSSDNSPAHNGCNDDTA